MKPCKIYIMLIGAALIFGGCQPEDRSKTVSTADLCAQTVRDYALLRDDPAQAAAYGALFTNEGSFTLAGNTVTGRDALIARHKAANENAVWRHNMTDIDITKTDGKVTGRTRFVVYTGARGDEPGPVTREIIGYYDDIFVLENERCLLQDRRVVVEFDSRR